MAFKTVTDLSADTTISLGGTNRKTGKKNPDSIEGYYLGSRQVEDKKKKSGVSYLYTFQTAKGNVAVWGKTDLDIKMRSVAVGTMVRASHVGMKPTPNGEMYKYKVEIDDENTIEVQGTPEAPLADDDGDSADVGFAAQASTEDDIDNNDEDLAQAAALAALERKAKVQALLSKNKKA